MSIIDIFSMPKAVSITDRTSSITNAFVNGIIPCIMPTEKEIIEALRILGLNEEDLWCAYCGDKSTEWDHLRPLVKNKRPTGYITEIHNLVPSCGKCNQSKGNKNWKEWMLSNAKLSPTTRNVQNIQDKIEKLEAYEKWKDIKPIDFEKLVGKEIWQKHWENCEKLHADMIEYQKYSNVVKNLIEINHNK